MMPAAAAAAAIDRAYCAAAGPAGVPAVAAAACAAAAAAAARALDEDRGSPAAAALTAAFVPGALYAQFQLAGYPAAYGSQSGTCGHALAGSDRERESRELTNNRILNIVSGSTHDKEALDDRMRGKQQQPPVIRTLSWGMREVVSLLMIDDDCLTHSVNDSERHEEEGEDDVTRVRGWITAACQ